MKNFKTYQLAKEFYQLTKSVRLPAHLKNQLERAASSVALNLAEGNYRATRADRRRFFVVAYASLKESQAVLDLQDITDQILLDKSDKLGAHLYRLIKNVS